MTDEQRESVRVKLSDWKLWMGIAYFMLAWVTVAALVDYTHASSALNEIKQANVQRKVEDVSAHRARIATCIASIPTLTRVNAFADGVKEFHVVMVENTENLISALPAGPQRDAVKANLARLEQTVPLVSEVHFHIPTVKVCKEIK